MWLARVPQGRRGGLEAARLTLSTNRRSLSPGMELDALLNSGESYSLGNRCQFAAITIRNILSLADASQQGNRALCSAARSKGFFFQAQGGHLIHLLLSLSPSITALGCTIYRAYISCLFRYRAFSKPLLKESELEMNLRRLQRPSPPPPCPQASKQRLPAWMWEPRPTSSPLHHHPPQQMHWLWPQGLLWEPWG